MRTHSKLILAALAATMLLAVGVSTATAGRLSVNERNFELIWNRATTGKTNLEFTVGEITVRCPVTLLGQFIDRTIKKETRIQQDIIHHATISGGNGAGECEGGTATIRSETLPWETRYRSFDGTLPRIRAIKVGLIGATWRIREPGGLTCEAGTEVNHPAVGIAGNSTEINETGLETTGEPDHITADRTIGIPLGGGFLCGLAGEGRFSGLGLIRNLPANRRLNFTLI